MDDTRMSEIEKYLINTIKDLADLAHGIDNRSAMLAAIDNLAETAQHVVSEYYPNKAEEIQK